MQTLENVPRIYIIVILMLTVPTLMGHSTVDAKQDSMEMEVFATISTNALKIPITATLILPAPILKDRSIARVAMVTQEMGSTVLLLISVDLGITIVMLTPTVPIPKDRSIARAIRDTQEMESRVLT